MNDDCDAQVDEDYLPVCGTGPNAGALMVCSAGQPDPVPCSNEDACDGVESCAGESCVPGTPVVVDDGNPCTTDSCEPSTGAVTHVPVAAGSVCNTSGQCNATGQCSVPGGGDPEPNGTDVEFVVKLPRGVHRSEVALGATPGKVNVGDYAQVLGSTGYASVSSVGSSFHSGVYLEDQAKVQTVWTEGKATLDAYSRVHGDLFSKGLVQSSSAVIVGDSDTNADLRPLEEVRWTVFFPEATLGPALLATNETRALSPGAYGAVKVPSGAHLKLTSGEYTMESLVIELGGFVDVDNAGPVFVYSKGGLGFSGTVTRTAELPNVLFGIAGTSSVYLKKAFTGLLVTPNADLILEKPFTGEHRGSFFGKTVTLKDHGKVRHEGWDPNWFCLVASTTECGGLCPCARGGECASDLQCTNGSTCGALGVCACTASCAGKECGDHPSDGCGGLCEDYCPVLGTNCRFDVECAGDSICLESKCVAASCATSGCDPAECGDSCSGCVPECGGRECGVEPHCGSSCGECDPGSTCMDGLCVDGEDVRPEFPPHPGPLAGASTIGSLPGQFSVSPTGRANYQIPIDLPTGTGGVRPSLSLTYTGSSSPGLFGAGWALGGLSSIARCKKSLAVDGWPGAIQGMDASESEVERDAVCLDGQRLILVSGQHLRDGARYRTEQESFRDIVFRGATSTGSWEVYSRDGTVSRYGPDRVWRMVAGDGARVALAWPLIQTRNRAGVAIGYGYECRGLQIGTECYSEPTLVSISYGMQPLGSPGGGPSHIVWFNYEPREQNYGGTAIARGTVPVLKERLALVSVSGPGGPIHRYRMSYASVTGRGDFLTSVTQCADEQGGEICLAPTTFDYAARPTSTSDFLDAQEQVYALPRTFGGGPLDKSDDDKESDPNYRSRVALRTV